MTEFIPTGIGGFANRQVTKSKTPDKSGGNTMERREFFPPPRPIPNFIPTPETIDALIERALAALARGIYWDRGSIINIVL